MKIGFQQLLIIVVLGFVIFYATRRNKNQVKEDDIRTYPKECMYAKKRSNAEYTEVIDVEFIEADADKKTAE